jgi:hypothetical protein
LVFVFLFPFSPKVLCESGIGASGRFFCVFFADFHYGFDAFEAQIEPVRVMGEFSPIGWAKRWSDAQQRYT